MTVVAFGTAERASRELRALRAVHDRVRGELPDGTPYRANDPELLLWVHATLVDTVLVVERRYLGRWSPEERGRYYAETRALATAFGVPEAMVPPDLAAFRDYVDTTLDGLEVSDVAQELSRSVLVPPVPFVPGLAWEPLRAVTIDLLPRRLREAYGLRWDGGRRSLLRAGQMAARAVLPRLPGALRSLPASSRVGASPAA